MSGTSQPISMASTASAISSPAPGPTMPHAQDALGLRIDEQLGQPFGAAQRHARGRWRPRDRRPTSYLRPSCLGLLFGQAGPGDFRIGEDDGRNRQLVERDRLAEQHFDGDAAFVRRLVGQHRLAGHVADRQDVRIGRAQLLVDRSTKPFASICDLRVLQAQARGCSAGGRRRPARGRTARRRTCRGLRRRLRPCRRARRASRPWCSGRCARRTACSAACAAA